MVEKVGLLVYFIRSVQGCTAKKPPPRDPTPQELALQGQQFKIPDDPSTYRVTKIQWSPQYAINVAHYVKMDKRNVRSTYATTPSPHAVPPSPSPSLDGPYHLLNLAISFLQPQHIFLPLS